MNDFDRVAWLIRYLDEHQLAQPTLGELASAAGMSESHLHRLFHRWAGVTPKDFLQCLTLEHIKQQLRQSKSVLEASLNAGLSGPGRAHDLCVSLEAASPGELKRGGAGLKIRWGVTDTVFGVCSLAWNERGICHLVFHASREEAVASGGPKAQWPHALFERSDVEAGRVAEGIFHPSPSGKRPLSAFVRGTPFQTRVWRALIRIPEGALASYQDIARALGDTKLARAVGTACGSNTLGYLIPCHRVIRETGVVQGFRWGTDRKKAMLAWEALQPSSVSPRRSSHSG